MLTRMDQFAQAFDMLDVVLAVFGALIVSLWFGRGKKVKGLLTGAFFGGVFKTVATLLLGVSLFDMATAPTPDAATAKAADKEQKAIIKMLGG
jgi:hypothetical protein